MSVVEKIGDKKKEIIQPKKKMGLLVENPVYKPFRYPWCYDCLLYTSPSPRDMRRSRMPSSA